MATVVKKPEETPQDAPIHRIRITLTSRDVKALERGKFLGCCTGVAVREVASFERPYSRKSLPAPAF